MVGSLEQKLLDDMRAAYAWTVAQAATGRGLKEMEQGLRERVMGVGAKLLQASLARGYGSGHTAGSIPCAGCSGRMRYVMERDKVISSWFSGENVGASSSIRVVSTACWRR